MKVTGLLLFLILLIVLVVSVIVGNKTGYLQKEGFINYGKSVPAGDSFTIPSYSSTNQVTKLFDNLFYDQANGNIIEIDSPQFLVGGNIDLAGTSILSTTVTTRSNPSSSSFNKGNVILGADGKPQSVNLSESATTSMTISYNSYKYFSQSKNTDKYCLFYMPWNNNTYMHVINLTNNTHVATFSHLGANSGNKLFQRKMWPVDSNGVPNSAIGLNQVSIDADRNNNTLVSDQFYDSKKALYQISQYVKYDITNGNLLVRTATGAIVYSRGNPVTSTSYSQPNMLSNIGSVVANVTFSPTIIPDSLGNNVILYVPDGLNTLVAVIALQNTASGTGKTNQYTLANVARFTPNTLDNGGNPNSNFMAMINTYMSNGPTNSGYVGNRANNYWGPPTYDGDRSGKCGDSDDYLLKTQIVPPVCPSCPSCGSGGVCGNCGGQGGSGTKSSKGGTMVTGEKEKGKQSFYDNLTDESSFLGEGVPTTGKKDAQGNDIAWKSDIGKGTFSSNADPNTLAGGFVLSQYSMVAGLEEAAYTAADVAKTGIGAVKDTAVGLGTGLKDTAGEVTGLVKSTGAGAVDLAKSTGSGAVNLAKSAGSGLMQMSKDGKPIQGAGAGAGAGAGTDMGMGPSPAGASGPSPAGTSGPGPSPATAGSGPGPAGTSGPGAGSGGVSYSGPQSMDQYSYYGALPAKKTGNYIPVTADFSSFRH